MSVSVRFSPFLVHHQRRFAVLCTLFRNSTWQCTPAILTDLQRGRNSAEWANNENSRLTPESIASVSWYFLSCTLILTTINRHIITLSIKIAPLGHGNLIVSRRGDNLLKFTLLIFFYSSSRSWEVVNVSRDSLMWCYVPSTYVSVNVLWMCVQFRFEVACLKGWDVVDYKKKPWSCIRVYVGKSSKIWPLSRSSVDLCLPNEISTAMSDERTHCYHEFQENGGLAPDPYPIVSVPPLLFRGIANCARRWLLYIFLKPFLLT